MITKEEFEKVVEVCTDRNMNCTQCPFGKRFYRCGVYFALYIKENEPAPAATGTSSEVSKDTNSTHLDDSTKAAICQEAEKAYKACELILEIYERMDDSEQKAFDLGQSYRAMVEVKKELERIGRGGVPNA
jgi:hypothetical protein